MVILYQKYGIKKPGLSSAAKSQLLDQITTEYNSHLNTSYTKVQVARRHENIWQKANKGQETSVSPEVREEQPSTSSEFTAPGVQGQSPSTLSAPDVESDSIRPCFQVQD